MTANKKQKPPLAIRVGDELEAYLRARAAEGHRTITGEIRMRLERTHQQDQQAAQQPQTKVPS